MAPKMFKVGMHIKRDYASLDYLQQFAAQYLPVPVLLVYDLFKLVAYHFVLKMTNAGPVFQVMELSNPLTPVWWIRVGTSSSLSSILAF